MMLPPPPFFPRWEMLGKLLLLALVYFACGKLGLAFPVQGSNITLFWLPSGIAVAALLRWGKPCSLPGIFLGALLIQLSLATSLPLALAIAAANTLAPLLTAKLLKHWRFDLSFSTQHDLFLLIAAAATGMLLSASASVSLLLLADRLQAAEAPFVWLDCWMGDTLGVLLSAPLLLSITPASREQLQRRPAESFLFGVLLCVAGGLVFFFSYAGRSLPLAFLPFPLVLWAALRHGIIGTSLAVLVLSLLTATGTVLGKGVFGTLPVNIGMYLAWFYMLTVIMTGLILSTLLGERQKIEDSLQHANDLLSLAQRKAKAGVWNLELASNKLTWSNELFQLFGLNPQIAEANFETWRSLLHPDDRQAAEDNITVAIRDNTPFYSEYRIVRSDGETKWITSRGNISRNENNEVVRMSGLCIDSTAQKEAQRRLENSEVRYKTVVQHAANALFVHDMNGRFIEINQQACDYLGYSREELLQMSVCDISPGFTLAFGHSLWSRLEVGKPHGVTAAHRRKDGSIVPVDIRLAALKIDGENMVLALVSDITARIEAEKLLLDSLHLLEEKELAKTRFLAAAGHDLRQPVAAANLFVEALRFTTPTPRQSELIGRLSQSMSVFSDLLERLLNISKFDAGLIKPKIAAYDLEELFSWIQQQFAETAHEQHLQFRLLMPKHKSLIVRTDIGLLQSALMNLINNALKFTSKGGILISARLRGDKVILQIWDTGMGIAATDLPHIFDEFFQADNPERNRHAGLGLGLSICQRAMSLLDCEVSCSSQLGRGTMFKLTLPLNGQHQKIEQLPNEQTASHAPDKQLLKDKRVAVLEDDGLVAVGLIDLLHELQAKTRHFHNAEEALR